MLKEQNKHPRDDNITFHEEGHKYTINGDTGYRSVTGFIKTVFPPISTTTLISKIRNSPTYDETNKYYNMTDEEIKTLWASLGATASALGSGLHKNIENFYNNQELDIDQECKEWKLFKQYNEDTNQTPYRTEWMIYDEQIKICGTVDMVFRNPDGTYDLVDWKRTKKIFKPKSPKPCNTSYWLYALQLNLYKYILTKNYDVKISNLYIVQLHPDQEGYKIFQVPHIDEYVKQLLKDLIDI